MKNNWTDVLKDLFSVLLISFRTDTILPKASYLTFLSFSFLPRNSNRKEYFTILVD